VVHRPYLFKGFYGLLRKDSKKLRVEPFLLELTGGVAGLFRVIMAERVIILFVNDM
jgi:hypothetical protein